MNKEERFKLYNDAETYWGHIAQYDQCIEECAELIVAINKYKRKVLHNDYENNPEIEENLVEELADVYMCLEQLGEFVGRTRFEKKFEEKLQKLAGQIEKQKLKQGKIDENK